MRMLVTADFILLSMSLMAGAAPELGLVVLLLRSRGVDVEIPCDFGSLNSLSPPGSLTEAATAAAGNTTAGAGQAGPSIHVLFVRRHAVWLCGVCVCVRL